MRGPYRIPSRAANRPCRRDPGVDPHVVRSAENGSSTLRSVKSAADHSSSSVADLGKPHDTHSPRRLPKVTVSPGLGGYFRYECLLSGKPEERRSTRTIKRCRKNSIAAATAR